jgi:hypothetical protein
LSRNGERKKFENVLIETIDETFSTLGENVKNSIYFHLKQKFMISRQDIPDKIDDFSDALEQIFGLGAKSLQILIMAKLQKKIGSHYKWEGPAWLVPDLFFGQYVALMRLFFEDTGKICEVEVLFDAGEQRQEQRA